MPKTKQKYKIEERIKMLAGDDLSKGLRVSVRMLYNYERQLLEYQRLSLMQDLLMFNILLEAERLVNLVPFILRKTLNLKVDLGYRESKAIGAIDKYEKDIVSYLQKAVQRIRKIVVFSKQNDPYDNLTVQQIQQLIQRPYVEGLEEEESEKN